MGSIHSDGMHSTRRVAPAASRARPPRRLLQALCAVVFLAWLGQQAHAWWPEARNAEPVPPARSTLTTLGDAGLDLLIGNPAWRPRALSMLELPGRADSPGLRSDGPCSGAAAGLLPGRGDCFAPASLLRIGSRGAFADLQAARLAAQRDTLRLAQREAVLRRQMRVDQALLPASAVQLRPARSRSSECVRLAQRTAGLEQQQRATKAGTSRASLRDQRNQAERRQAALHC